MTATPAIVKIDAPHILKTLEAMKSPPIIKDAVTLLKTLMSERDGNQIEHNRLKNENDDLKARIEAAHLDKAVMQSIIVDGTSPPLPVDLPGAYGGMVERAACAAIAMQPAPGWLSDRQYDGMTKPEYGEAIRINVSQRILAQPVPAPGAKV
jgi:hypothetical protein